MTAHGLIFFDKHTTRHDLSKRLTWYLTTFNIQVLKSFSKWLNFSNVKRNKKGKLIILFIHVRQKQIDKYYDTKCNSPKIEKSEALGTSYWQFILPRIHLNEIANRLLQNQEWYIQMIPISIDRNKWVIQLMKRAVLSLFCDFWSIVQTLND